MRRLRLILFPVLLGLFGQGLADDFDYHVASLVLLQVKEVQKEVGISEAQRKKLNTHAEWHKGQLKAYADQLDKQATALKKDVPPDEAKLQSLFAELKKRAFKELTPAQLKRLREVSLQQLGFSALNDSVVAKKVGLNDDQLTRVRKTFELGFNEAAGIERDAVQSAVKPYQDKKPKDEAERDKIMKEAEEKAEGARKKVSTRVDQIREFTRTKIMGILTPEQRNKFEALKGKPFKVAS